MHRISLWSGTTGAADKVAALRRATGRGRPTCRLPDFPFFIHPCTQERPLVAIGELAGSVTGPPYPRNVFRRRRKRSFWEKLRMVWRDTGSGGIRRMKPLKTVLCTLRGLITQLKRVLTRGCDHGVCMFLTPLNAPPLGNAIQRFCPAPPRVQRGSRIQLYDGKPSFATTGRQRSAGFAFYSSLAFT
jgi:hypothetical protein